MESKRFFVLVAQLGSRKKKRIWGAKTPGNPKEFDVVMWEGAFLEEKDMFVPPRIFCYIGDEKLPI